MKNHALNEVETQGLEYNRINIIFYFLKSFERSVLLRNTFRYYMLAFPPTMLFFNFNIDGKKELNDLREVKNPYLLGKQPSDGELALAY